MRTIHTTFKKNYVEVNAKYKCGDCGFKFYRKNRDWFTMTFMNVDKSYDDLYKEFKEKLKIRTRQCPKCDTLCHPILNNN
jgi:ribosomal protein S27AE